VNNPFFYYTEIEHFPNKFVLKKKDMGDVSDTPTMMRMKLCLDHSWITMTVGLTVSPQQLWKNRFKIEENHF